MMVGLRVLHGSSGYGRLRSSRGSSLMGGAAGSRWFDRLFVRVGGRSRCGVAVEDRLEWRWCGLLL